MTCEVIRTECLKVGDRVPVTLDFTQLAARRWRPAALFALSDVIRGKNAGFEFVASNAGQTSDKEPRWPKAIAATIQDGSILWTAQDVSVASLIKTLVSALWSAPAGITITGESTDAVKQTATAYIQADAIGLYQVTIAPTFSDTPATVEGFAIDVEVR